MTKLSEAIPDPAALLRAIDHGCTNRDSFIHGPAHWRGVAFAGLRLVEFTRDADPIVVLLFSMFHDTMRRDDGHDPMHGPRAEVFAASLHGQQFQLPDEKINWLLRAIRDHTGGRFAGNPSIACCWDADRLNLWRLGVRPDPAFLTTPAARSAEMISWARRLEGERMSWEQIIDAYRLHVAAKPEQSQAHKCSEQ